MEDRVSVRISEVTMRDAVIRSFLSDAQDLGCDIEMMSPQLLAYVGDTVYDLFVRTYLLCTTTFTPNVIHKLSTRYVRASAQAEVAQLLIPLLSEDECAVFKRGRNAHNGTVPKSASVRDYRMATGLEALIGYHYLRGNDSRVTELMGTALEIIANRDIEEKSNAKL